MGVANSSDREIINRFLSGSESGFEELVSCYEKKIYSLCLSLTHSESDSEAILSDVFCKALDSMQTIASQDLSIANWLYKTTIEFAATRQSAKRSTGETTVGAMEQILANALEQHFDETGDEEGLFRSAMQHLPYEYRAVYALHEVVGSDLDDISEIMDISEIETRTYLHRARLMICRYLQRFRPAAAAIINSELSQAKRSPRTFLI